MSRLSPEDQITELRMLYTSMKKQYDSVFKLMISGDFIGDEKDLLKILQGIDGFLLKLDDMTNIYIDVKITD